MSSLDRAFFRAYAKEQPMTADADALPSAADASPYVHIHSSRTPQLRYRIEPTHAPWGAVSPGDTVTIETPHDESDNRLADADEMAHATAWSSEGEVHLAVAHEPPGSPPSVSSMSDVPEVVARSAQTPAPKSTPPDPYADGIVCLPGMGIPESNYLATLVAEELTETDTTAPAAPSAVQSVEPVLPSAAKGPAVNPGPPESTEPPVAESAGKSAVVAKPAPPSDRASLLADEAAAFWEVDRYLYPTISDRLLSRYEYFSHAGDKLKQAAQAGLKVLGITGVGRDEGRSTLAICLARAAARAGLKVVLADCDFQHPSLAQRIGLDVASGWESVAQGELELAEVAIRSLEDDILLLPLLDEAKTSTLSLEDERVQRILAQVRRSYDVVILDTGPSDAPADDEAPGRSSLDAAIVVWDRRRRSLEEAETVARRLSSAGVEAVGIAENFAG